MSLFHHPGMVYLSHITVEDGNCRNVRDRWQLSAKHLVQIQGRFPQGGGEELNCREVVVPATP
jgi:hypothetical protein